MSPLLGFAFEVSPAVAVIGCLLLVAGGLAAGKLLWKDDRALKMFQRECNDLSDLLSKIGFQLLPPILRDVAILDFAQLGHDLRHAEKVLTDPEMRAVELTKLLAGLVEDQLNNAKTAQVFLDDVVADAKKKGYTPSASALAGASDDSLLDSTNPTPPVTVNVHNYPTGTEAAAAKQGEATVSSPVAK